LANFLLGKPDIFTQAGGDFTRDLRGWELGSYAQDEYRISSTLTLNYGVRYEITTPFRDIHNRMMEFAPGHQSTVYPNAPTGLLFPGDSGVPDTIAPVFKSDWAPRIGFAWNPLGNSRTVIRSAYGIFYDELLNGVGMPFRATSSALGQTVVRNPNRVHEDQLCETARYRGQPVYSRPVCATRVHLHHRSQAAATLCARLESYPGPEH